MPLALLDLALLLAGIAVPVAGGALLARVRAAVPEGPLAPVIDLAERRAAARRRPLASRHGAVG